MKTYKCLNPYSNGRYSRSAEEKAAKERAEKVLILILMEDTLGGVTYTKAYNRTSS